MSGTSDCFLIDAEPDISILIFTRIYHRLRNPKRSWQKFIETWEKDHRLIKTADKLRQLTLQTITPKEEVSASINALNLQNW